MPSRPPTIVWIRDDLRLSDHQPWLAAPIELAGAGIALGKTYP